MGMIQPDFSQEVVPPKPGIYRAKVVAVEPKSGPNSDYLNWKLIIDSPGGQFTVFHSTPINGKGAGFLRKFVMAFDPNYNGGSFDPYTFIGKTLQVALKEQVNRDGAKTGYLTVGDAFYDSQREPFPEGRDDRQGSFNESDIPF